MPAGVVTIRYSVYNLRQKSRLSQPIPLFSFPHMEAPAPSDTASFIVGHVHDELIIECSKDVSHSAICDQMARTPPWAKGLVLRADGYETYFYKKD